MSTSDYTPWASRPGYDDLSPIAQADPSNSLVPIAYSEKCKLTIAQTTSMAEAEC